MKKVMKWLAIAVVGVFGVLLVIGFLMPDKPTASQQAQQGGTVSSNSAVQAASPAAPMLKANYAPDQCLDSICVGMAAGELTSLPWAKKNSYPESEMTSAEQARMESFQNSYTENCESKQPAWGSKSKDMCAILSRGASGIPGYGYQIHQVPKMLDYFASQTKPVCEFDSRKSIEVRGFIKTESGNTEVTFKFDANGMLRVFEIFKLYADREEEIHTGIVSKLTEKHPYAINPPLDAWGKPKSLGANERDITGEAPWGGTVRIEKKNGLPPKILMNAKLADFDQSNLAICKQAKPVSVQ